MLYRAARVADATYFPALFEYTFLMLEQFRNPELMREFPEADSSSALASCMAAAARQTTDDRRPLARWHAIEARFGPSPCTDVFLLWNEGFDAPRGARALRENPDLRYVRSMVADGLLAAGRAREADSLWRAGGPALADPQALVEFGLGRTYLYLAKNDTAGAIAHLKALEQRVRRDPRPIALERYLFQACTGGLGSTRASRAIACDEHWTITHARGAGYLRWDVQRRLGKRFSDEGTHADAIPYLNRAVALAESLGVPGQRLITLTLRGRAYWQLGRTESALRDLKLAVNVGSSAGLPYFLADAYHNMAHAYEHAGRLAEASAAGDRYIAITDQLPNTPGRYMSRHDQGMILWAGGWHAAATRSFQSMVRVIDEQDDGHSFAGEYYERIGQLGRAIEYYRAGAQSRGYADPRSTAALSRLYEALDMPDSAEAAAHRHDAMSDRWPLLERPVLPDLLFRHGRKAEAIVRATSWAGRETTSGNVQGATRSWIHVAELHLMNGDGVSAARAARMADSLSRVLLLVAEGIEARTVLGRALVAEGKLAEGIARLRDAVRLANAHPSTTALLSTNLALGKALETARDDSGAVAAFGRAANAVETMTASLGEDVNRAAFKSNHLAPFDGALRVTTSRQSTAAAEALAWSARRKAAALALAGHAKRTRETHLDVGRLRRLLASDEALIDFTVLDSSVIAIVARRSGIDLVRLSVSPSRVTTWAERLRRPLVSTPGGRIDLAHARFDAAVAESLYVGLFAPAERLLAGVTRLAIVPDGALWYLPFAALAPKRSSYLVERYEIRMLPSATFLGGSEPTAPLRPGFRVDAMTYSVAGGSNEIHAIETVLGQARVVRRDGSSATERAALGANAEVLHIAAHGIVDDRDALASHLRLAPSGTDDGLLHLSEVTASRMKPRLIVLTACEAVNGRLYAGEGLVGLARAFLMSGARQVIASQWPVDASAGQLTSVFYRELARGLSPSAALRTAQRSMLQNRTTSHPIHWAGFVAFGGQP